MTAQTAPKGSAPKTPPAKRYKSRPALWLPFALRRMDGYFVKQYVRTLFLILFAIAALIAIGDIFQRFDEFVLLARREDLDFWSSAEIFLAYYASWTPQLILQFMFPMTMLLAAAITVTSSFAGPRGNNEYVVIRSAGVPVLRSFLPLLLPAFLIAAAFQAGRDFFLPDMVRDSSAILGRLQGGRVSNPTSFTHYDAHGIQTASIGYFAPGSVAHNLILEVRDPEKFRRGDPARGDNDFTAYRASAARLEPAPGGGHQWTPLDRGEVHSYTRFSRTSAPWTAPVPTGITPAMIERQPLGDAVSSWSDLLLMRRDNPGADFEMHWRLAEPAACVLLILWGAGVCMARMLRGRAAGFISSISVSMIAAALFYILRLAGKTLWENGTLTPAGGAWLPLAAAFLIAVPVALRMEP